MIKVGIIGSTGYAGAELVRLLLQHPQAEIVWYGSKSYVDQNYADIYRNMFELVDEKCMNDDMEELARRADVIFTATPQGLCASMVGEGILEQAKVIDLSADFRLKDVKVYEKWYHRTHEAPQYIPEAVYGLCEINRSQIPSARIVANPGCYTTASILALYPLVADCLIDPDTIIIDAKSGTSGAGRGTKLGNLYCEVNESIKPYGVATHRHTPEIEEQLSYAAGMDYKPAEGIRLNFTPHLVPMNRGILATCYATLKSGVDASRIQDAYEQYYQEEYFIRLLGKDCFPETRWVEGSNFVDIGFTVDERTGRVIAASAIDNLVKGAAGQAVQNMNLLFGLDEKTGLQLVPVFP
ncbi:MAG TPA: N-acetyl-gamma-glutamyl-phosphate reductase [Lachnospiraceae bacterium]|nr:N-acetyl-gamma-glutamyl-phosphate reductase [Lachnospiraceae bacterium]